MSAGITFGTDRITVQIVDRSSLSDTAISALLTRIIGNAPANRDDLGELSALIDTKADIAALLKPVAAGRRAVEQGQADDLTLGGALLPTVFRPSFRRRLVNGEFRLNQRAVASASTSYAAGVYTLDRWKAGPGGVTLSWATGTNGDVTVTITAGTLVQVIEGARYLQEGGAYTLSWAGTATARIYQGAATGIYAASPVAAMLTAATNATVEVGTGTITLAQLEPGIVATVYERRDDELQRAQRYTRLLSDLDNIGSVAANPTTLGARFAFAPMYASPTLMLSVSGSWSASDDYATGPSASPVSLVANWTTTPRSARANLAGFSGLTTARWYGAAVAEGTARLLLQSELQ